MGSSGLEPPTSRLSGARSNQLSYEPVDSVHSHGSHLLKLCRGVITRFLYRSLPTGDDGIRTHDPLLAGQVLSQLSYTPIGVFVLFFCNEHEEFDNPSKLNNKRRVR